jgi:hypothetical protein
VGDSGVATAASVYTMHNHINRDGFYIDPALTAAKLSAEGTIHLDTTFAPKISGNIHSSPLYVANGVGGKGTFYVATTSNNVYAINETNGALAVPVKNLGATGDGVVGTPAIDPTTRLMVLDGGLQGGTHTIFALSIDDLSEKWRLDTSTITDKTAGAFPANVQSERSAVLIVNGTAYVSYGGHYGDGGSYHGWVIGVPLTGPAAGNVKEYATPTEKCGMWAAGGPASDGTNVFVSTGNPGNAGASWGGEFAVMRFQPGPVFSGNTADFWHNVNDSGDQDLSGANPLVVDAPSMTPSALLAQFGKDGNVYLLDRSNMNGNASPLSQKNIMGNAEMSNAPAWATVSGTTYLATISNDGQTGTACPGGTSGDLVVMKLDPSVADKITVVWCANNNGGGSPIITTSDGSHDALLWTMGTDIKNDAPGGDNQMHAWDLATGTPVVTGSDTAASTHHFTSPIVVNGRLIQTGNNALYAFKP